VLWPAMLSLLAVSLIPSGALQSDWPHFLGPDGTNQVAAAGITFDWEARPPEVTWRTAVGPGFGGVAIQGGEVFLLDRDTGEGDLLRVFDLESGEERWLAGYAAPGRLQFPGSRTVCAVREDLVYAVGGFGQVAAFDRATQEVAWLVEMAETYGGELPMFGWSNSPLIHEDLLIVTPLGPEVGLLALDRKSGEEVWTTPGGCYSHSTPVVLDLLGEKQLLFLSTTYQTSGLDESAPMTIAGYDPRTGDPLWRGETTLTRLPVSPPVRIDDERFFVTGGYRGGSSMMKLARTDGGQELQLLFHIERGAQIHPPILHDGHLYVLVNENWNDMRNRRPEGGLLCLTLDGKEVWRTGDAPYFGRGNMLLVGDHLVIQDGLSGILRVARATPEGYQQVAEANLFEIDDRRDHQMWAPMALAGDRLLLRSQDELLCVRL
jgi:outer membrane protein assembly factor BamB